MHMHFSMYMYAVMHVSIIVLCLQICQHMCLCVGAYLFAMHLIFVFRSSSGRTLILIRHKVLFAGSLGSETQVTGVNSRRPHERKPLLREIGLKRR